MTKYVTKLLAIPFPEYFKQCHTRKPLRIAEELEDEVTHEINKFNILQFTEMEQLAGAVITILLTLQIKRQ